MGGAMVGVESRVGWGMANELFGAGASGKSENR